MYEIEIHTFGDGQPVRTQATARTPHEAYLAVLKRIAPACSVRVTGHGGSALTLWIAGESGRVRIAEQREWYASDPGLPASGEGDTVGFTDPDGARFSIPRDQAVTRDQALVALADWLDGGERTPLLSWT